RTCKWCPLVGAPRWGPSPRHSDLEAVQQEQPERVEDEEGEHREHEAAGQGARRRETQEARGGGGGGRAAPSFGNVHSVLRAGRGSRPGGRLIGNLDTWCEPLAHTRYR